MNELSFPLLGWLTDLEGVRFNLASSSVKARSLSEWGSIGKDMVLGYPEDELEERVEKRIAKTYEADVYTAVTPGAQAANSLVFDVLLEQRDEVLVEDPAYTPLQTAPALKGAEVKYFKRRYEDGFELDIKKIKETCSSDTRMIVITNPHNPSGVFQRPKDLQELDSFIEENDIYLLVDEIYRDFVKGGRSSAFISNNVIVTSSLSKVYGLGGLRFGWAASKDEELIADIKTIKSHLCPNNPTITLEMGLKALEERDRYLSSARETADKGRSLARGWIKGTSEVEWVEPSPGIISFPRLKMDIDGEEFAKRAKEAGVLVAPGSYFSHDGDFDSHIRLTFGKDFTSVVQGFQQLSKIVQNMSDGNL